MYATKPAVELRSNMQTSQSTRLLFWGVVIGSFFGIFCIEHSLSYSFAAVLDPKHIEELASTVDSGSTNRRIGFFTLGAIGTYLVVARNRFSFAFNSWTAWAALLLAVWVVLSLSWTNELSLTGRRVTSFLLILTYAVGLAMAFSAREIIRVVFVLSMTFLLFAFVYAMLVIGDDHGGLGTRFGGTTSPNRQAVNCLLLIISGFAVSADADYPWKKIAVGLIVLFGVTLLLFTGSRTASFSLMLTMPLLVVMYLGIRRLVFGVLIVANICIVFGLLWSIGMITVAEEPLFLGRGLENIQTLNGRIPLWEALIANTQDKVWMGSGYGASMDNDWTAELAGDLGPYVFGGAHSVYVGTYASLGLIGLSLLVFVLIGSFIRGITAYRKIYDPSLAAMVGIFICLVLDSGLEAFLFSDAEPLPLVLAIIIYMIYRPSGNQDDVEMYVKS